MEGSSTRREHFSTDTDSPDAYARCRLKTRTNRRGFSYRKQLKKIFQVTLVLAKSLSSPQAVPPEGNTSLRIPILQTPMQDAG
uniref:Uncharacterized protein n=1 Tax=Oryza sativa subsp. japonica TaxID=39947 RepID=Q6YZ31_ORYSJ|nr:hypothetical protein [Oryza sativa Japonica Group]